MSQHKYNDAYNEGYKAGQRALADALLDYIGYSFIEEPDEKEEGHNEALLDIKGWIARHEV